MTEIWKDIIGFEGLYKVSNFGKVESTPKFRKAKNQFLKGSYDNNGYLIVCLTKDGKEKMAKVHRLIAQAFIPNPENKPHINHINGDTSDNRIKNLEWCTPKENNIHSLETGLRIPQKGSTHYKTILSEKDVLIIRRKYELGEKLQKEMALEYGMCKQAINDIIRRKTWKHV